MTRRLGIAAVLLLPAPLLHAQNADLAKKLSNPVSAMISLPFQFNFDRDIGSDDDGEKFLVNIQPVVPISLNQKWNIISRTILPVVSQSDIFPGSGSQSGLGDTLQSLFFTPKETGASGIIWGAGPVLLLPTATDRLLGGEKWGAGPTVIVLKQTGPWTFGALGNHVWSFAGSDGRADIDSTFIQPILSYTTPSAWTFGINSESSRDWIGKTWSVPINVTASKLMTFGSRPVSLGGGIRYWAASPGSGPDGFGARLSVTLLYPK